MSDVEQWYIDKFNDKVTELFEQEESKLSGTVDSISGVGEDWKWPVGGSVGVVEDKPIFSDYLPTGTGISRVNSVARKFEAFALIPDIEQAKSNVNYENHYVKIITKKLKQQRDLVIIDALKLNTNVIDVSNTLNLAGMIEANAFLMANDVPFGNRYAGISVGGMKDALADPKMTSRDYDANADAMGKGFLQKIQGFDKLIVSTLLPRPDGQDTQVRNFFWHKESIGLSIVKELRMRIDYVAMKGGFLAKGDMMMGAVIKEPQGVCEAHIND